MQGMIRVVGEVGQPGAKARGQQPLQARHFFSAHLTGVAFDPVDIEAIHGDVLFVRCNMSPM
jgi:hypothetical protein